MCNYFTKRHTQARKYKAWFGLWAGGVISKVYTNKTTNIARDKPQPSCALGHMPRPFALLKAAAHCSFFAAPAPLLLARPSTPALPLLLQRAAARSATPTSAHWTR